MENNKTLLIDKEEFLNWYFDYDIIKDFFHRQGILQSLKDTGEFKINLQELLDGVGYLPENVVVEGQEVILDNLGEVAMDEYDVIKFSN